MLGFLLGRLQSASRSAGSYDPIGAVVSRLVYPISEPLRIVAESSSDWFRGLGSGGSLIAENRALRARALAAELYDAQISRLERELEELRSLGGYPQPPGKVQIAASVTGYFPYENRISLNVGRNQGIKAGQPVVGPEGLVGIVQSVEASRCQALLITAASLRMGGLVIDRNPPVAGLISGGDGVTLAMSTEDVQAPIKIGDRIVTSGFSDQIPRGIPIGSVIQIEDRPEFGTRRVVVFPFMSVGNLREVLVYK